VYNTTKKVLLLYKLHLFFQSDKQNDECSLCSITFLFMKGKPMDSKNIYLHQN